MRTAGTANFAFSATRLQTSLTSLPGCTGPTGVGLYSQTTGVETITLSDEDTEADALARFRAHTAWGGWTSGSSASCLAHYEQRTSGFSWEYQEVEYRITKGGLPAGQQHYARVYVYRRLYGSSDPFELYQTLIVFGNADENGDLEITGPVPNDPGYETYVDAACVVLAPPQLG